MSIQELLQKHINEKLFFARIQAIILQMQRELENLPIQEVF